MGIWWQGIVLLLISFHCYGSVRLANSHWSIDIEPSTLAVHVIPTGQTAVDVSKGHLPHPVSELVSTANRASWYWDQRKWQVTASLNGHDLALSIQAHVSSTLTLITQPKHAAGRALLLPLAEGSYIPTGDKLWSSFLANKLGAIDTAESMALPLWGIDYGHFSLHWILQNPFGNQLSFQDNAGALSLALTHHFSALSLKQPMKWMLHLAPADPLAGAKRYRQWLIAQGLWQSLEAKVAAQPQVARLFGASHIYLWDNALLTVDNVRDWAGLLQRLRADTLLAKAIRARMANDSLKVLRNAPAAPDAYQKKVLIAALNEAIEARVRVHWQVAKPNWAALPRHYQAQRSALRAWLSPVLTEQLTDWGGGLSSKMLLALSRAGLKKLWLGLGEGWEGGLWHPEAVRQAVAAGYLVAPYDSYETGLSLGDNPSWTTAHLGAHASRDCAVIKQDGSRRAGFQGHGHYLNPLCTRPILQQRMMALHAAVPFNSWFLDAYGAAMAWDDFRPNQLLSEAAMVKAYSDNMAWVRQQLNVVVGSEKGTAPANRDMVFGHGTGTPLIGGWLDPDFKHPSSPWFLGRWYPMGQPEIFFKSVLLKEPYRRLYHDPVYRLPLYQAVFHDSVITTSHWLSGNLKFSNTRRWDHMTQLLYNVPPLYHLNLATLPQRLPVIQRHDQFFRPLHQQLVRHALTGFRWLSPDRKVQQTLFADGSRLTANGSSQMVKVEGEVLAPGSVLAQLPGQTPKHFMVKD